MEGRDDTQAGLGNLLGPLLKSPVFWVVCALSFGITLIRETFGTWTPQYPMEVAGMEAGAAGWIDGVGYIGGILAGKGVVDVAEHYGWARAFLALACVPGVSCIYLLASGSVDSIGGSDQMKRCMTLNSSLLLGLSAGVAVGLAVLNRF